MRMEGIERSPHNYEFGLRCVVASCHQTPAKSSSGRLLPISALGSPEIGAPAFVPEVSVQRSRRSRPPPSLFYSKSATLPSRTPSAISFIRWRDYIARECPKSASSL